MSTDTHRCLHALEDMRQKYGRLHDGLSDMIESGRLTAADIPDDYDWLVMMLAGPCIEADQLPVVKSLRGGAGSELAHQITIQPKELPSMAKLKPFGENSMADRHGYDLEFLIGWLEDMVGHESGRTYSYKGPISRRIEKVEQALELLNEVAQS